MRVIDPGHVYYLTDEEGDDFNALQFVKKEDVDGKLVTVLHGSTNEDVLNVLIDRVKYLNGKVPSEYNDKVIEHLEAALFLLAERTAERLERGVEGTSAV